MSTKFSSIILVTYGRSGSTLLQGILNSIPGFLIRGENENFCLGLYECYKRLLKAKNHGLKTNAYDSSHAWYGAPLIDIDLYLEHCTSLCKDVLVGEVEPHKNIICYGFKEIRYHQVDNLHDYLNFLEKIFPNVCFIFNTRNLDDVLNSAWWKKTDKTNSKDLLQKLENKFDLYAKKSPHNTFQITYEEVVNQTNKLKLMFEFMELEYSVSLIEKVLRTKHSTSTQIPTSEDLRIKYNHPLNYNSLLTTAIIHNLPKEIPYGKEFGFEGVAIPAKNDIQVDRVKIVSSETSLDADLGFDSPLFGIKYPNIYNSNKSKFKVNNLIITQKELLKVLVIMTNGQVVEVATITVEPQ